MQGRASEVGTRRIWLRGLLFGAVVAPLLGSLLAAATVLALKGRPPASILVLFLVSVTTAYIVATGPALVAAIICTSLALYWRSRGISRRPIVLRLAVLGIALGAGSAVVSGSLAEGHFIIRSLYVG